MCLEETHTDVLLCLVDKNIQKDSSRDVSVDFDVIFEIVSRDVISK